MATIKFKDLIKGELQNKVRKVKDLVDYVGKTPSSHPNYSIFLGAGASVSSDIKTGGNLVNEWRKEAYEKDGYDYYEGIDVPKNPESEEIAKQRAIEYLIKEHGVWYNPQNEYSSLFERKFDLPIQRRRFVEELVDGRLPSIGYLYLITLINKNYFNTVFTTNFDDLINEAFYQFSNTRPLICAHDSAVSSISLVAKRPKIIKLHGDYLFDDIKNTIKETESLEQNIKQKFIEFTKDNGLIVVGYSGQDRSILDVINYLLQQEDYLKNGLYWCFRAEDEINHEVRKILWRDKVYCVEIDGFDELFSEFCSEAKVKPSLIDNISENKREKCINKFVNDYNKSKNKNKWVGDFIEEISIAKNNQDLSDLIRQLNENKTHNLSSEKLKNLLSIEALIKKNDMDYALEVVNESIREEKDDDLIENYYVLKVRILKTLDKKEEALKLIDKLIEKDKFNIKYYQWKLMFITNIKDKISFLVKIDQEIFDSNEIKNSIIQMFIKYHEDYEGELDISFDDCEKLIDQSLNLDASLDNEAYRYKFNFLKIRKTKELKKEKTVKFKEEKEAKIEAEMDKLIEKVNLINKYNIDVIRLNRNFAIYKKDMSVILDFIRDAELMMQKVSKENAKNIINIISFLYNEISVYSKEEVKSIKNYQLLNLKDIDVFFDSFKEDENKSKNIGFMLEKSKKIIAKNYLFSGLYENLNCALELTNSVNYAREICDRFSIVRDSKINEKLDFFIEENKSKLSVVDYLYCLSKIKNSNRDYCKSLEFLTKYYKDKKMESSDYIHYIYALLIANKYDEVFEFFEKEKDNIDRLSNSDKVVTTINRITANKLKNGTIGQSDRSTIENIISKHSDDKRILICANSLLDKNSEALHHIKDLLCTNYTFYYELTEWPAINSHLRSEVVKYFESLGEKKNNQAA